ncbi:type II secretion system F family protein [Paenisporosarcina cavernae]|uniref:Type II secretion system F family protein n=1 Tax=Paenisporosarcina cavernae TaxID=2320858 RepID=A0A385YQ93_9BACL|nr:type II secretion system F family protein [Paenisporosarcina cavernae]AYC28631.1 type II secretion system F family protein [Paenisporosarcina cavernae]
MTLFSALITLLLFLLASLFFILERKRKRRERIAFVIGESASASTPSSKGEIAGTLFSRLFESKWKQFKKSFNRSKPDEKSEKIDLLLQKAGHPFGMTPFEFRLMQIALVIVFPFFMVLLLILGNASPKAAILLLAMTISFGAYIPKAFIKMKIKARAQQALKELSDFIDLLAVSMEAGLGFDQALSKVVSKKHGVLADEFQRMLEELRLGRTRREALSGVRSRLESEDIQSLISSIIQAEQLGVGMVQILRIQSEEVRVRRKQRAEEKAMKAPIKMLFPLVIFIFPTIFIVLLGPVVLNIMDTFSQP